MGFPKLVALSVQRRNAGSILCTRSRSIRKARTLSKLKESGVTTASRRDTAVRPNPSSGKRRKPPKRSSFGWNAPIASVKIKSPSKDASISNLEARRRRRARCSSSRRVLGTWGLERERERRRRRKSKRRESLVEAGQSLKFAIFCVRRFLLSHL